MKHDKKSLAVRPGRALLGLILAIILMAAIPAGARTVPPGDGPPDQDKTLSPYFFVKGGEDQAALLPLKSTHAQVTIVGNVAEVRVTQVYENQGKVPLEAIYIFPAGSKAAIHAMKMTVGKRVIQARIQERAKARKQYEEAKAAGKTASLLEQQRPNVFQMNVANILPKDVIKVELAYSELLVPQEGIYQFVYPTVVGPRYAGKDNKEQWVANPYLHEGEKALHTFGLDLTLKSALPVSRVSCPSHRAALSYPNKNTLEAKLPASPEAGNRDFVLRFALEGEKIASGLWVYEGKKENHFLLMLQPPAKLAMSQVSAREYIFIVDVSGSMHGFPLNTAKALMKDLLGGLRAQDHFNIMLFAGGRQVLAPKSLPAAPENIQRALDMLSRRQGGGSTQLLPALKEALALPRTPGVSRSVVVITDGYVRVEREAFELVRQHLGEANLFSFGIGSSVNRFLVEGLARAGGGEPWVVLRRSEAPAKAAAFRKYISTPVLTNIKVQAKGLEVYDLEPAAIPDLFAARPIVVLGKFKGKAQGSLVVTGRTPKGEFRQEASLASAIKGPENAALARLWARERIARLADLHKLDPKGGIAQEVTKLGLAYSLMTRFTSFVAVDEVVRADGKKSVTVRQPLPLPQGVSDHAVGGRYRAVAKAVASPPAPANMRYSRSGSQLALQEEVRPVRPSPSHFRLAKIITPVGYDQAAAKRMIIRGVNRHKPCAAKYPVGAILQVQIIVNANGRVRVKTWLKDVDRKLPRLTQCLAKTLSGLSLPIPKYAQDLKITLVIQVR